VIVAVNFISISVTFALILRSGFFCDFRSLRLGRRAADRDGSAGVDVKPDGSAAADVNSYGSAGV
jgi:hypothetical protein